MRVRLPAPAAAFASAVLLLTAACGDVSPVGPRVTASDAASARTPFALVAPGGDGSRSAFETIAAQWPAYKAAAAAAAGPIDDEFAHCAAQPRAATTRTIGPAGGQITVGAHTLDVPAGALSEDVEITAVAIAGAQRKLEFAPHGLQFAKPVRITMSYDACAVPAGAPVEIVYTGAADDIIARQPSLDLPGGRRVEAWTDHFSGYLVGYGRR